MKQMRILGVSLLSVALLCVCACTSSNIKETTPQTQNSLVSFVDSLWTSQPNAMNNDITRQAFADSAKLIMQRHINDTLPILSDIEVQYSGCELYKRVFESFDSDIDKNAGRYLVTFHFDQPNIINDVSINFDVVAVLDADKAGTLVEDSTYHVQGTFVDFANNSKETGFTFPDGKCRVHYPSLHKDGFNHPALSLGTIVLHDITIKQ